MARESLDSTPAPGREPVLAAVATGDPAAIRECLARYGRIVWSIARRYEPGDPEDAVQEIFLDLWKSAKRFDPAIASEAVFVAMIARRRLIDRRRAQLRQPATEPIEHATASVAAEQPSPALGVEAAQAARALERLRPEQREVLVMASCEGLSHQEIAARTGLPLGTVKSHARRGLLAIRAALLGVEPEDAS
jgi:RNA polymerase sigma-70 factor (ECF subfamily)